MQEVELLCVQRGFCQQRAHADHTVERRAYLMAHGGQKRRLGAHRFFGDFTRSHQLGLARQQLFLGGAGPLAFVVGLQFFGAQALGHAVEGQHHFAHLAVGIEQHR
ncbi:hypothetical protein GCM10011496_31290 [Polaromonas eurypsychrophila]|uniref:Uncharacterized protein n=1 Tax=Polaromonas eurypsychrophila TaxID=1614635 RepID=A0A916SQC2_9BURK|nr:hypothetical protein GCM10011496_31290 [Polaromonas eurypsychrophila]